MSFQQHGRYPDVVIMNIPRCLEGYISYQGMEMVVDGIFTSTKYEGGTVCGDGPHLVILANNAPDLEKMSSDRFKIVYVGEKGNQIHPSFSKIQEAYANFRKTSEQSFD